MWAPPDARRTAAVSERLWASRVSPVLTHRVLLLAVLAVGVLPFVLDLGGSSIWDANEAFYVETPREMVESGDYVNPAFNYEPRFNKPVLPYWLVAGLYQAFGVSLTVQRAAIAAFALVVIAAAWPLGRAASVAPGAGVLAAIGLAANPRLFMFGRRILIDVALTAFMTLVLVLFALSERYPRHRRALLIAMYVCVGLGVLTKGPVAAVLPAAAFLVYLAAHGELRRVREMMIPLGAALGFAIVAPWYVALYLEGGWTHISGFFIGENLERFTNTVGPQSRGLLFYVPVIFSDGLPWSLLLPAAVVLWWRDRRAARADPALRIRTLLLAWIATIVLAFSLSETKQDLYIFPIVAAVSVLGADVLGRGLSGMPGAAGLLRTALLIGGVLLAVAGAGALYVFQHAGTVYALDGSSLAGTLALAGGGAVAALARARFAGGAAVALACTLVAFNWTLLTRVLPDFERYKPVVPLAERIRAEAEAGDVVAHYDVALPSMVFYLERHIHVLFDREAFVELFRSDRRVFAVLPEHRFVELQAQMGPETCELARHATFDARLREVLSLVPPPAVVLVSNRCPS